MSCFNTSSTASGPPSFSTLRKTTFCYATTLCVVYLKGEGFFCISLDKPIPMIFSLRSAKLYFAMLCFSLYLPCGKPLYNKKAMVYFAIAFLDLNCFVISNYLLKTVFCHIKLLACISFKNFLSDKISFVCHSPL